MDSVKDLVTGDIIGDYNRIRMELRGDNETPRGYLMASFNAVDRLIQSGNHSPEEIERAKGEHFKIVDLYDEFQAQSTAAEALAGNGTTPTEILLAVKAKDFGAFMREKQASGRSDLGTAVEGVVAAKDGESLAPHLAAGGAASSAMVTKALDRHGDLQPVVEAKRAEFEAYSGKAAAYAAMLVQRQAKTRELVKLGVSPEEADSAVMEALSRIHGELVQTKKALPPTLKKETRLTPAGGPSGVARTYTIDVDPFVLPPEPRALPEGRAGQLWSAFLAGAADTWHFGDEARQQVVAAQYPVRQSVSPITWDAAAKVVGTALAELPVDVAATAATAGLLNPVVRKVGTAAATRGGRAALGAAAGAVEGGLAGAARTDVEAGDVKSRAQGAAVGAAVTGAFGGAGGALLPGAKKAEVPKEAPKPRAAKVESGTGMSPEADSAAQTAMTAIKKMKKLSPKQEFLDRAERKKRAKRIRKALYSEVSDQDSEEAFKAARAAASGKFEGPLEKAHFQKIEIPDETYRALLTEVKNTARIGGDFERLSAEGALAKLFRGTDGSRIPARHELRLLSRIFGNEFVQTIHRASGFRDNPIVKVIGGSRALLATGDMSATLRQGAILGSRHPGAWARAFRQQARSFFSKKKHNDFAEELVASPDYQKMKSAGVDMTAIEKSEEAFARADWAEAIPVLGNLVRGSNRAYSAFLTQLRVEAYRSMQKEADKIIGGIRQRLPDELQDFSTGDTYAKAVEVLKDWPFGRKKVDGIKKVEWETLRDSLAPVDGRRNVSKMEKDFARVVNWGTGRGSLGPLNRIGEELGTVFFSPRFMASRIQTYKIALTGGSGYSPVARRRALQSILSTASMGSAVLGLAALQGAEIGTDPLSSDYGKIILGGKRKGTRVDIWGGHPVYFRLAMQLSKGKIRGAKSSKTISLDDNRVLDRGELLFSTLFRSKATPAIGAAYNLLVGSDFLGNQTSITREMASLVLPIIASDIYELAKEDPSLLPAGTAGSFFGLGVQSFSDHDLASDVIINKTPLITVEEYERRARKWIDRNWK